MKHLNRWLSLLLCAALLAGTLPAVRAADPVDVTDQFTDPIFRETVYTSINKSPGMPIYDTDVAQVKELYVSRSHSDPRVRLQSLTGLEYFTGLELLEVNSCDLPALDVSPLKHLKVLRCSRNRLKTLDLTGLNELTSVNCGNNCLTELRVSSPALDTLRCENNLLTELDLSGCSALDSLICNDNYLEALDLSACPKLRSLGCSHNYMKDISAVVGFDVPAGTDQFIFDPQNDERIVPRLDYDAREMICEEYFRACDSPEVSRAEVRIDRYYGCFDGFHVLLMRPNMPGAEDEPNHRRIGGYVFYLSYDCSRRFFAYRDGSFITLSEAFASGQLTRKGLRALFDRFNENVLFPFTDVEKDAWYYRSVRDVNACKLFNGVSEERFAPEEPLTRSMLAVVLWRLFGEPYLNAQNPFIDIPYRSWYSPALVWAAENRIVEGVGGNRFAPDDPVTREELIAVLYRMEPRPEPAAAADITRFADHDAVTAVDAVGWALNCGILEGSGQADGTLLLKPAANATRAEAAALLMRYIDRLPDQYPIFREEEPEEEPPQIHAQYSSAGGKETLTLTNLETGKRQSIDVTGLLPPPDQSDAQAVYSGTCTAFYWEINYYLQRAADGTVCAVAQATEPEVY